MEIGQKLKEARIRSGFTQESAAEKIDVSRQTISNWENEKSYPDIVRVIELSNLYSISLDELLKGDSKMLEKIEKDTNIVKSNLRMIRIGWLAIILSVILAFTNFTLSQSLIAFISSAAPWVLLGVGVAIVCAYMNHQKKQ